MMSPPSLLKLVIYAFSSYHGLYSWSGINFLIFSEALALYFIDSLSFAFLFSIFLFIFLFYYFPAVVFTKSWEFWISLQKSTL